jgi:hypothetical protein
VSDPVREWIVQRCINVLRDEYEDWPGYCARLMTREEMKAAFVEYGERWPECGFRGHGGESGARQGQVTRREVSVERPSQISGLRVVSAGKRLKSRSAVSNS